MCAGECRRLQRSGDLHAPGAGVAGHGEQSVWVLEMELGSPGRVVRGLDPLAISPDQQLCL